MPVGETGRIHCNRGDYDAPIGGPYGIPESLVRKCIENHERAFTDHHCEIRMHADKAEHRA